METIGVGIIGTGIHGSRYARHIMRDVDGLELVAISRRSEEGRRQADEWQATYYQDFTQLVADDRVGAVIGVTFPVLNLEIARLCAVAGKPLLLEKPLADSSASAAEIVRFFKGGNPALTVGQTLRYNSVVAALKAHLADIGQLYGFSANQRLEPSSLNWHAVPELAGAGVSFHTAVHVFDALRFITGAEVKRVMALSAGHTNATLEDLLTVLVEMDNGVQGTVDCSKVGRARTGRFEFVGSEGQLHGEQVHGQLELARGISLTPLECPGPVSTIELLLKDWRDFLTGHGENPVSGQDGLAAVRICEACLQSARSGHWVELG